MRPRTLSPAPRRLRWSLAVVLLAWIGLGRPLGVSSPGDGQQAYPAQGPRLVEGQMLVRPLLAAAPAMGKDGVRPQGSSQAGSVLAAVPMPGAAPGWSWALAAARPLGGPPLVAGQGEKASLVCLRPSATRQPLVAALREQACLVRPQGLSGVQLRVRSFLAVVSSRLMGLSPAVAMTGGRCLARPQVGMLLARIVGGQVNRVRPWALAVMYSLMKLFLAVVSVALAQLVRPLRSVLGQKKRSAPAVGPVSHLSLCH